ncbi:MAG TPA: hypothetical protein VHI71_06375 [Actinomycetota bacterium]|nr:hypothetical protein [Actinomycetota bacterium]
MGRHPDEIVHDRIWGIMILTLTVIACGLIVRAVVLADDKLYSIRVIALGVFTGIGVVASAVIGLSRLYRKRPRVWLSLANPMTVAVIAGIVFVVAVHPTRSSSLRLGYILGMLVSLHWTWVYGAQSESRALDQLLGRSDEERPES